ncbi:hypothetical protein F4802DRAFT_61494 [Xylaria palmicola]|nr:hypothetical protein F4802DRAFT_61494 [Xylaria palmicola]
MASNQTCDVYNLPSFESLPVPRDIPVGGLVRRNDTLLAMQLCCAPNPVNAIGDCVLWCEIPARATGNQWLTCVNQYVKGGYAASYRNRGTTATSAPPTMVWVVILTLLISSFCSL